MNKINPFTLFAMERKEQLLQRQRPENPLTEGFLGAADLSNYFTHYSQAAYDNMARRLKITAYKFKDDGKSVFFSLEEVLDVTEPAKMKPLGTVFQDKITKSRRENGFTDWQEIAREFEEAKALRVTPKVAAQKARQEELKKAKEETVPMSDPPRRVLPSVLDFSEEEDDELARKRAEAIEKYQERKWREEMDAKAAQEPRRYEKTIMEMKPFSVHIDVLIETEDPEVFGELKQIYSMLLDLKRRTEK